MKPTIAIIGAGAGGLMAADYLADCGVSVEVYEQMPSAGRKMLWAGKTGLNITHSEPMTDFVSRYLPNGWLDKYLYQYDNRWLTTWFDELGIKTYVGSSGRVFPVAMKGSPFLRAWLKRLQDKGVKFFYRHQCVKVESCHLEFCVGHKSDTTPNTIGRTFDAIILACGGGSYQRLGSDGRWQSWFGHDELTPLYASNVGIVRTWSPYMKDCFGQALKRVGIYQNHQHHQGDIIISHYGMESSLIYRCNALMRSELAKFGKITLILDLLPDKTKECIVEQLTKNPKQSLNNRLRKAGLDAVKIALLRECTNPQDWKSPTKMAEHIKTLAIDFTGFRPLDEAISTGGGIRQDALTDGLQLKSNPSVFCCGEMLDFDAPTGGYLLTACFATGRVAAANALAYLQNG